ncbi:EamA family transporter [Ureibacillus sp. FSL K6-8385]|uniref:EamA family transporter n=1 Tax=Ureibacillus terrenus TaxID=118246 RepID=A0A540V6Y4_9BACL|nr:EamA family transporter [Ureibacillus terrenus]MED3661127.1 EamA family transporter [Ureibacillus terrenus]MED3764395.1 EamA family transporter [Ureibacillus terrenus]TQE91933.1 EamA family transporter [Ureibacillus terrenus]
MNLLPYIFVLLAGILWGTTGTTQTFLQEGISPIAVAGVRSAIGGGILLIAVLVMRRIHFKKWSWRWTILAALAIALFQCLFFTSIRFAGVAVGTVVTIGSSPVFSGIMEWVIFKRRPDRVWGMATLLAIIGCILLFANRGETEVHPFGILLALCAGMMFALYTNFSKRLTEREETLPSVAMTFTLCALFLLPFSGDGVSWVFEGQNFWPMLFMGIVSTSMAYIFYLTGLEKISSSSAVTLSLAEPLTAALLGVFLVGEYLSPISWIGVILLLGGIIVLTFGSGKAAKKTEKASSLE